LSYQYLKKFVIKLEITLTVSFKFKFKLYNKKNYLSTREKKEINLVFVETKIFNRLLVHLDSSKEFPD